jgi:DNA-binding GntR family transcriptional regulator
LQKAIYRMVKHVRMKGHGLAIRKASGSGAKPRTAIENRAQVAPRGTAATPTLAETVAARIREQVISGRLTPGSHLSETALSDELQVSRNTLREVFRLLTTEGLLRYETNRGVFVSTPDMSTIVDIYRVRRFIECPAIAQAHPGHPAVKRMRAAVEEARKCRDEKDWLGVGSADIAFHAAIVELSDSPRLASFYAQISLELRLVFGLLQDPEFLHGPFIDQNFEIVSELEAGRAKVAADLLEAYLVRAERFILGAYGRVSA